MSPERRNQWGGLIAEEPGGYQRDYGLGHPFVDDFRSNLFEGAPHNFRIQPSLLRAKGVEPQPEPQANTNGRSRRSCAVSGHSERRGPWGPVCYWCYARLPEPQHTNGRWVFLGTERRSKIWVPSVVE